MNYPHNWTNQGMQIVSCKNESFYIVEVDIAHSEFFRHILMKLSKLF